MFWLQLLKITFDLLSFKITAIFSPGCSNFFLFDFDFLPFYLIYLATDFFLSCLQFPGHLILSTVLENYQPVFAQILPLLHPFFSVFWIKSILDLTASSISLILFSLVFILLSLCFILFHFFWCIFQFRFFSSALSSLLPDTFIEFLISELHSFLLKKVFYYCHFLISCSFHILSSLLFISVNTTIFISVSDNCSIWCLCTSDSAVFILFLVNVLFPVSLVMFDCIWVADLKKYLWSSLKCRMDVCSSKDAQSLILPRCSDTLTIREDLKPDFLADPGANPVEDFSVAKCFMDYFPIHFCLW